MGSWRGAIGRGMALAIAWGIAWAPLGVLAGIVIDPTGAMDEPWIALGAYPGFLSALIFAMALRLRRGRQTQSELTVPRAIVLGMLSGLLVAAIPFALGGTPNTDHVLWRGRFLFVAAVVALSALSAVASILLMRLAKRRVAGPVARR